MYTAQEKKAIQALPNIMEAKLIQDKFNFLQKYHIQDQSIIGDLLDILDMFKLQTVHMIEDF